VPDTTIADFRAGSRVLAGGHGPHTLLLLHGLGATADVWHPLLDGLGWNGRWLAPDLPGHGGSAPLSCYSVGAMAARVAELLDPDDDVVVLGHSFGGVVGLALASGWFAVAVRRVVTLGIKVAWTDDEQARMATDAKRPVRHFDDEADARALHVRLAGLQGITPPDAPEAAPGVVHETEGWRLALDPGAFAVGVPDMVGLLAVAKCPVLMARGETDPLVSAEQIRALGVEPVVLAGRGHSAHVEDPAAVRALIADG
jgi:pimeloyl-ACP methyl ester carboxylesterase